MKQVLKSSGANCIWKKYLCVGCFYSKQQKKLTTSPRYSHHTIRSAEADINKMSNYIIEEKVPEMCPNRGAFTVVFEEPLERRIIYSLQDQMMRTNTQMYREKREDSDNVVELDCVRACMI